MRSWETDIFFKKQVLKKFLPTLLKILQFHLISWCGNFVERHSLSIVLYDSPKTVRKLRLSTMLPQHEITVFFCSVGKNFFNTCFSRKKMSVSDDLISHVTNFLRTGLTRLSNGLFFRISAFLSRLELIFSSKVRLDKMWKFHSLMLTNFLVRILHADLYIIKYVYILNSTSEIVFKFGLKVIKMAIPFNPL